MKDWLAAWFRGRRTSSPALFFIPVFGVGLRLGRIQFPSSPERDYSLPPEATERSRAQARDRVASPRTLPLGRILYLNFRDAGEAVIPRLSGADGFAGAGVCSEHDAKAARELRIPRDVDQRSELMSITIPK